MDSDLSELGPLPERGITHVLELRIGQASKSVRG